MAEPIINKVEESGLISLDLEKYYPSNPIMVFDVKDHLFMGLILKEKILEQRSLPLIGRRIKTPMLPSLALQMR